VSSGTTQARHGSNPRRTSKASAGSPPALGHHASRVIDGERQAEDFLRRLHAEQAKPDELAQIMAPLYGPTLRSFARVLTKALEVRK